MSRPPSRETREANEKPQDHASNTRPSLAARRGHPGPIAARLENGVLIPEGMSLPLADGYRTPMGEDYERNHIDRAYLRQALNRNSGPGCVRFESPSTSGALTPRKSLAQSLNLNHLTGKLNKQLSWKIRIRYFTWAAFCMNMATGGVAHVLYNVPFRFQGLDTIGTIFFLLNIVLYIINIAAISTRFYLYPETFKASLTHPTESLFMPAAVVSLGTILLNVGEYGLFHTGVWLTNAVHVLFWIDAALAIVASSGTYLMLWSTQTFTIAQMTPIWIFPAYPLLIIGPQAALLSKFLSPDRAQTIILAGFTMQGIGYLVSLMIYSAFIYRLMTQKLPKESSRPAMFVSVGPCGFTASALINLASNVGRAFGPNFLGNGTLAAMILNVVADWAALWVWGLACWFFLIALGAHISCVRHGGLQFSLPFFSFIFPNTALIVATFSVASAFDCYALGVVGTVLTVILILVWLLVFGDMLCAIWNRKIFWPQRQEDRDEGGFKAPGIREGSVGASIVRKGGNMV